ncbi:DUF4160 domain-containing protein [Bifidobacterium sp. ESL0763]|uniref:DUF4160 domain-containing protein n=1 Tax=Bifidobacterium sp. ESL0763 TaxID=2983227 RepID=UPI0023FA21A8|nr:DUF4160 domain-containing protein [Bifidobacterium sp. ESL0763]MDF7664405.1 DUF4160 domain-containing protein [Bifidobacterium sp. ESL0763]
MTEKFFIKGYEVSFNDRDGEHGVHVHVCQGRNRDMAKFVFAEDGDIVLSHNRGKLPPRTLRKIRNDLARRYTLIVGAWDRTFGSHHFDR